MLGKPRSFRKVGKMYVDCKNLYYMKSKLATMDSEEIRRLLCDTPSCSRTTDAEKFVQCLQMRKNVVSYKNAKSNAERMRDYSFQKVGKT